jgi:hypothetical protein
MTSSILTPRQTVLSDGIGDRPAALVATTLRRLCAVSRWFPAWRPPCVSGGCDAEALGTDRVTPSATVTVIYDVRTGAPSGTCLTGDRSDRRQTLQQLAATMDGPRPATISLIRQLLRSRPDELAACASGTTTRSRPNPASAHPPTPTWRSSPMSAQGPSPMRDHKVIMHPRPPVTSRS